MDLIVFVIEMIEYHIELINELLDQQKNDWQLF